MKMKRAIVSLAVVAALLFAARPALAHHSRAMFDIAKNIKYQGVVVQYQWQNPHNRWKTFCKAFPPCPGNRR